MKSSMGTDQSVSRHCISADAASPSREGAWGGEGPEMPALEKSTSRWPCSAWIRSAISEREDLQVTSLTMGMTLGLGHWEAAVLREASRRPKVGEMREMGDGRAEVAYRQCRWLWHCWQIVLSPPTLGQSQSGIVTLSSGVGA